MPRGRPPKSAIRQNLVEMLAVLAERGKSSAYGYELFKIYRNVYPRATLRVLYYHLRKGTVTGEFVIDRVEQSKGEYSWGSAAEKVYYTLGPQAEPKGDSRIRDYLREVH